MEQKKDLRGLGHMERTGSEGILGRAGTDDNTCAAEVGKYIVDMLMCFHEQLLNGLSQIT